MAAYTWTTFPVSGSANFETTARAVLELWRSNTDDMEAKLGSIADGTIDAANVTIPSGKTLDVSAGTFTLATDQISGDKVEGGTINAVTVNTLTIGTVANGSVTVGSGKTLNVSAGTLTLAADQISGDKVEGGTINAVTINTLTSTTVNATTVDTNVAAAGVTLSGITLAADGTDANIDINITPKGTGEVNITKVDIDAGTIDGATISTSNVTVGSGKTIDVSAGTLTLANDQISGDKIHGGTISAFASTGIDDNADAVAITIDSSERVGIGTTSPVGTLSISSNYVSIALNDAVATPTTGGLIRFTGNGAGTYMYQINTAAAANFTTSNFALYVTASGLIGIGSPPVNKLDVEGAVAIGATYSGTSTAPTNGLIVEGNVGIGTAIVSPPGHALHVKTTTGIGWQSALFETLGIASLIGFKNTSSTGASVVPWIEVGSYENDFIIRYDSNERFRINNIGNVGIGALPVNKLDVEGAVAIGATYSGTSTAPTNGLIVEGSVGIGTVSPGSKLYVTGGSIICDQGAIGVTNNDYSQYYQFSYRDSVGVHTSLTNYAARGTSASPSALQSSDSMFTINTYGWDGTQWTGGNSIIVSTDGTVSNGVVPTALRFYTNATNAPAERMRITSAGNVGIGTTAPNANAILDVTSTTKAFMPPRMTTAQRDAVSSPAAGMVIYNTTTGVLNFHNGTAWGAV